MEKYELLASMMKNVNKEIEVPEGLRLRFCYDRDAVKQYVSDYQKEDVAVLKFNTMSCHFSGAAPIQACLFFLFRHD